MKIAFYDYHSVNTYLLGMYRFLFSQYYLSGFYVSSIPATTLRWDTKHKTISKSEHMHDIYCQ